MILRRFGGLAAALVLGGCVHLPRYVPYQDPLNAQEHIRLGNTYAEQGLREQAERQFQAARRLDPDSPEPWVALGNLAYESGQMEQAESLFLRALKKDPRSAGAANNLAMVFLARERLDEAERWAKQALWQNGPLRPYVLDTLAEVYFRQKRYAEAESATAEALVAAAGHGPALSEHLLSIRRRLELVAPSGRTLARP